MAKIPGNLQVIRGIAPSAGGSDIVGDYISLKYAHRLWVVYFVNQGNATKPTLSVMKANNVAGSGATAMTELAKIYTALDCATSDVLARQADAASFELDAALKEKLVVFEINTAKLGGYKAIAAKISASNAANIVSALYIVESRYGSEVQPSMIVD